MAQVTTVGEVQAHESAMGRHDSLVDLQVGRAAAQALNIHAPFCRVEMEGLEGTLLAKNLDLVDVLVSAIIPMFLSVRANSRVKRSVRTELPASPRSICLQFTRFPISITVFLIDWVCKGHTGHGASQSIEDGTRGDIFAGNQNDILPLALYFLFHDLSNLGIQVKKGLLEHLVTVIS